MRLFAVVLDRMVHLYQLTALSSAGSYYCSHMRCFATLIIALGLQFSVLFLFLE